MSDTLGSLLDAHAYTPAGYAAAVAARTAFETGQPTTASLAKKYPLLAVCGDMVSAPDASHRDQEEGSTIAARFQDVSDLIADSNCTYFSCLGDNVYERGQLEDYQWAYHNTFGRLNAKCLPVPGNHEYMTTDAADYYTYFGLSAGIAGRGYYATAIANWRFIALNSCTTSLWSPGSGQLNWLAAELAAHPGAPKVVAWHHPRWTDGATGSVIDDPNYDIAWQMLYAAGKTQMVLVGHDHNYQRWDNIKSQGTGITNPATVSDGITQFVVGAGGNNFFNLTPERPGYAGILTSGGAGASGRSTYGHDRAFGALFLRLGPTSWDWMYKSIDGVVYDQGTRAIH